jgi:FtsH-binding integral membrane protein
VISVTCALSVWACSYANQGSISLVILLAFWVFALIPGLMFLKNHHRKTAKAIEVTSSIWTLVMYLVISGVVNSWL